MPGRSAAAAAPPPRRRALTSAHPPTPLASLAQLGAAVAELVDPEVPIKRLLLLLDLARQGQPEEERAASLTRWAQVLRDLAVS